MIAPFFSTRSGVFICSSLHTVHCGERPIHFRSPVAVTLPAGSYVPDFIQVQGGDDQFVLVFTASGQKAPVGIAEIRRAEKFPDIPWRFGTDTIDRTDEIAVGYGVRALLQLPQIIGVPFGRRRRN